MQRVSAHLCQAWGSISIHKINTQTHSHTYAVIQHTLHGSPLLNCAGRGVNGHSAATRAAERDAPGSEGRRLRSHLITAASVNHTPSIRPIRSATPHHPVHQSQQQTSAAGSSRKPLRVGLQ